MRFADDQIAVVGLQPAGAIGQRVRHAVVDQHGGEGAVAAQTLRRRDRQLVPVAAECGGVAVDADGVQVEAVEVEVEARQVLGRLGADRLARVEHPDGRVVAEVQHVLGDVVAAVAVEREVRVVEAGGSGRVRRRRRCCRRDSNPADG